MKIPSKDQLIIGQQSIRELLKYAPEKFIRVFTVPNKKSEVLDEVSQNNIPISFVKKEALTKMAGTESHQMLVAQIKSRKFLSLQEFVKSSKETSLALILDQIFDPQNFGAIIRCAECLGASCVIWSKNRGAELTPVVAKTSSGASEIIPLVRVSNLSTTAQTLKKEGFEIVAAQMSEDAKSAFDFQFAPKTALIMGSEGEGIQPLLSKQCDHSLYIPMRGQINSLNVAQATTALLTLWGKQTF